MSELSNSNKLDSDVTRHLETYSNIDWNDPFKGLKKNIQDAGKNIKDTTKDIGKNIERTTTEIVKNPNVKKALKANFLTYNPAIAIPRSSALLAFRVNLFGISSRLYPAFLDEAALKKGNFNLENAKNAKNAWEKVANFWEDKIGGDRNKLKEAISGAWNKPVFKTKKSQERKRSTASFDGDEDYSNYIEEAAVAGYITAGLSIVGSLLKVLADNKAKKNPYNDGTPQANNFNNQLADGGTPPPVNEAELNNAMAAARSDKEKGLGLDNTGVDASELNPDGSRKSGYILGIPKTAFWIGVSVLGLLGGIIVYKKFIKK